MAYEIANADYRDARAGSIAGASLSQKAATATSIIEAFDPIISRLETLIQRTSNCGDRLVGSRPANVTGGEKDPEPNHLIWAMQARRERLSRAVEHLESEIIRVENGLA